ncbi:MAG: twin-arginine translocation signal domain-containing protein, partial [Planctomycetales bacterium]|nr:twin-arginine translocation signal domain-containing protein [Planctomycetales bacterium]
MTLPPEKIKGTTMTSHRPTNATNASNNTDQTTRQWNRRGFLATAGLAAASVALARDYGPNA